MSENGENLKAIAQQLIDTEKKVQLIYAFNGVGKTRLSRAVKELIAPKGEGGEEAGPTRRKILYYNAFTEDLFSWDNDIENDEEPKLEIKPNTFTDWVLRDRGQDRNIVENFQRYTSRSITPNFLPKEIIIERDGRRETSQTFPEILFNFTGGDNVENDVKISKGEESNLIWSIFYTLLQEVIELLSEPDPAKRDDDEYDLLQYVFIDDPVSSLDENHLIELAFDLGRLLTSSDYQKNGLKFIITTHNPLFFNVLCKELKQAKCAVLRAELNGKLALITEEQSSFSYHLHIKRILEEAIEQRRIEKFHFNLLRNLYEKTANFLGYSRWTNLLETAPDGRGDYLKKLAHHYSHRDQAPEEVAEPTEKQKEDVAILLANLIDNYGYSR